MLKQFIMKYTGYFTAAILSLFAATNAAAQPAVSWNCAAPRSEFISYSQRAQAESRGRADERNFIPLTDFTVETDARGNRYYTAAIDVSLLLLDREIYLHTEGGRNSHRIYVNGVEAGSARDSRLPSEFNISRYVREGANSLTIQVLNDTGEPEPGLSEGRPDLETVFVYSQPRISIEDYTLSTNLRPDNEGEIWVEMTLRNGYNYPEKVTVGFDVYGPDGKLQNYDLEDITIEGRSTYTLRELTVIYGVDKKFWTPQTPQVFRVMMYVRRNGIVYEYIPAETAFTVIDVADGEIFHNGKPVEIKAARYNASGFGTIAADIKALKKKGVNTVYVDYPQPHWFYEACNREGMYVIDQANINTPAGANDLAVGGTLSNDPAWAEEYIRRAEGMYYRTRNHPCVLGFSTGGPSGNGYNMQKTYLRLKELETIRPIVYPSAAGEWNSDVALPAPIE